MHDRFVHPGAVAGLGNPHVAGKIGDEHRVLVDRVGDEPERPGRPRGGEVLARVAAGDDLLGLVAADAHVPRDRRALGHPARDEVVAVHALAVDRAVVEQAQEVVAVLLQQRVRVARVDRAAEQVRDLAVQVPRVVVLQAPLEVVEQQLRRAAALDLLVHRADALVGHVRIGEPLDVGAVDDRRAGLEDVARCRRAAARPP